MKEPRHVLVVAPQCPELGALDGLEDTARSLHRRLTEPWSGGCEAGASPGPTLLCGQSVGQAEVEEAVRGAAREAARAGAVLVLALLGHGMSVGTGLYFMTGTSRAESPTTGVDVASLLTQTLDTPGLAGVIALVDTCHAAGAIPDLKSLTTGIRHGAARLALLMASGAGQEAYDLRFTRSIVEVLARGVPDAGRYLRPAAVLASVRETDELLGQNTAVVEFDGDHLATMRLWLARNPSHPEPCRTGSRLGPVGTESLADVLALLGRSDPAHRPFDPGELGELHQASAALPPVDRAWARGVLDGLRHAVPTVELLGSWPGSTLTTAHLRRALVTAGPFGAESLPATEGDELLRDAVEFLLLRAPVAGRSVTEPLAAFVAALALDTGVPADAPELTAWARSLGAGVALADAVARLHGRRKAMRLRLVVSLHAAVGDDWPESLDAWLLDGTEVRDHIVLKCIPSREDVERKLAKALKWAVGLTRGLDVRLRRVEIAAPVSLLLEWRPEETDFGLRLGVHHDVVLRWSDHIHPPEDRWWINERARACLEDMVKRADGAPVDWLDEPDTRHVPELEERLSLGAYSRAVALGHRPARLKDVMEQLLAYAPIVLWPTEDGQVPEQVRGCLDTHWDRLPAQFCEAYRGSWRSAAQPSDGSGHLARLRAVWHDLEWLDFCRWFEQYETEREDPV